LNAGTSTDTYSESVFPLSASLPPCLQCSACCCCSGLSAALQRLHLSSLLSFSPSPQLPAPLSLSHSPSSLSTLSSYNCLRQPASKRCYWSCCTLQRAECVCECVSVCVSVCVCVCTQMGKKLSRGGLPLISPSFTSSAAMELQQAESQQHLQTGLR